MVSHILAISLSVIGLSLCLCCFCLSKTRCLQNADNYTTSRNVNQWGKETFIKKPPHLSGEARQRQWSRQSPLSDTLVFGRFLFHFLCVRPLFWNTEPHVENTLLQHDGKHVRLVWCNEDTDLLLIALCRLTLYR